MGKETKLKNTTKVNLRESQFFLSQGMLGPISKVVHQLLKMCSLTTFSLFTLVRSLASYSYRKALDSRKHFHLDFFTIDFNEEFSALYGGVLEQQTSFAIDCITRILTLYKSSNQHKSLVLIGHSMVRKGDSIFL